MSRFDGASVRGFLHTQGRKMINGAGEEVVLRGWAAANWTNPEGFMVGIGTGYMGASMNPALSLPARFQSGRTMTQTIRELCGSAYARDFWPRWHLAHLAEADIRAMAEEGYNSIRLPLTAWVLLPEEPEAAFDEAGFAMLDRVLDWCEKYKLYAIIDPHGAPGGQSGLACDDGLDNIPHMFHEPESYERALLLWEEIARRYADRWIVGGYELLNEPISSPRWHHLMPQLEKFYDDAIARIRKHDKEHMVILEGVTFCTNVEIFHRAYDPECNNWAVSIHLYNPSPEIRDLYKYIEVSQRLNVPVWIGEGRCKDPAMAVFYEIAAAHDMGFNLWAWKSVVNTEDTGAVSYDLPEGFDAVIKYATEGGPRPGYAESQKLFDALIEAIRYENCHKHPTAHTYCQRRQGVTLPAAGYDPHYGLSFSSNWHFGNPLAFRTEDHTRLVLKDGVQVQEKIPLPGARMTPPDPLGQLYLQLDEGAFACYTVRSVTSPCAVTIAVRAKEGAKLAVTEGENAVEIDVPAGDEVKTYAALTLDPAEARTVKIESLSGAAQLESVAFAK